MNTRDRRTKQEHALLMCAQFFRDELRFAPDRLTRRQREKFEELKTLTFDALDDPTMVDANEIERRYSELQSEVNP